VNWAFRSFENVPGIFVSAMVTTFERGEMRLPRKKRITQRRLTA
jgi:hypothetical protein